MKRALCPILLAAVALMATARPVLASDVTVIANPSVKASEISADELKGVFLATKSSLADGSTVEPVLAKAGAAHEQFLKEYLGKTDAALATYYRSLVFTGKASMPKICASDAEMAAYVAKTKGAIGYVTSAAAATGGVKTLTVK
jgi:ABC-type phosphate transport system substrate-binding protein